VASPDSRPRSTCFRPPPLPAFAAASESGERSASFRTTPTSTFDPEIVGKNLVMPLVMRSLVISSLPTTEVTGALGRKIESRLGGGLFH
jgi:hypothetical protein